METISVEARGATAPLWRQGVTGIRTWHPRIRGLGAVLRWVVLIEFVYIFIFPVLFMVTTSIKTLSELNNPAINWISRTPSLEGYRTAIPIMGYLDGLRISTWTSVAAALGQTLIGAMIAYGFARVRFPGREVIFAIMLFTIVVPVQTIMIPMFMLYNRLNWTNTHVPLFAPAFLGWGVRGGILLIVYRQFFKGLPYELEDAAKVDGAGPFRTFWQIMLPLAKPAVLVVLVFSLTWTWNDAFLPWLVISSSKLMTIPQRLEVFWQLLNRHGGTGGQSPHPNTFMAATTLAVLPMIIMYAVAQRQFTQSIDRTGLVE